MSEAPGDQDAVEASPAEIKAAGIAVGPGDDEEYADDAVGRYTLLMRARSLYDRIIDERWAKVTVHGFLVCPQCGAMVFDKQGKTRHIADHRKQNPSLEPILRELEALADAVRERVNEE